MFILWIISAIIIFSIVILVHEFWHFFTARLFWVKVEEFWLWLPPKAKVLFKDKKWTIFTLNWLPLWGFVRLTGENINTFDIYDKDKKLYNNFDLEKDIKASKDIFDKNWWKIPEILRTEILKKLEENNAPYNLSKKPAWQQAIIMLAWVFMNFLLAFFIFFALFLVWIKPIWINDKIETNLELKLIPTYEQAIESWILIKNPWLVLNPIEWSVAEKSWLKAWDILYNVEVCESEMWNWGICKWWENSTFYTINKPTDLTDLLQKNIWNLVGFWVNVSFNEDGSSRWWSAVWVKIPETWKIWTYLGENIKVNENFVYKYWILDSIKFAFIETKNESLLTLKWLSYIIRKIFNPETPEERKEALESVSWPIWIVDFISSSLQAWFIFLIIFWAIISISLWVFNLLPIPALDWWRFLFILTNSIIEKIFWKKIISEITEAILHTTFFIILIALSVIIAYNDISKIINNN